MESTIHPYLTQPDIVVLQNLFKDIDEAGPKKSDNASESEKLNANDKTEYLKTDDGALNRLKAMNDPKHPEFQPTVVVTWDEKDIPPFINEYIVRPYTRLATRIVRHPADVVFLTHIILYMCVNVPSAVYLFYNFSWIHGVVHTAFTFWCAGSFTLLMHNHIHNNGVLSKDWAVFDFCFPYILEPLMGHTWDSYYYHHVKHHHVEGNGPNDLSSTLRYQRDDIWHFLHYVGRFLFLIWLDLPLYFARKKNYKLALQSAASEYGAYFFLYYMTAHVNARASTFTLIIPFMLLRLGLMIGNWGQHALVDELEPDSDYRSSITLVDVPSNRFCFNDGYHTGHHLNPRRHWRDQPVHFLESKAAYRDGRALVFHNIDYLMMTLKLMQKDYLYLANCLVPMGDQIGMSQQELADMLRTKTRRFTEEEIEAKFKKPVTAAERKSASVPLTVEDERRGVADEPLAAATATAEVNGECRSRK
ncbi:hypothetical protein Q7P36_009388 [Cladosporium allicinum]